MSVSELIDPATLMRIKSLELRARLVVEGFQAGLNRSPFHGFSVEFSEYREYSPGDDPRYIDWKLAARSDRCYIKRFEDETNLRCLLILDLSRSMDVGSVSYTKADDARTLSATLCHYLLTQRDAVGLMTFSDTPGEFIPPRFRIGQMRRVLVALERSTTGTGTSISQPLADIAARQQRRGMMILISDLLTPTDGLTGHLGYLRSQGHEVVLFQVLDPAELSFNFDSASLFEDMETGETTYVDPRSLREKYLSGLQSHLQEVQKICDRHGVTRRLMRTDEPLENALSEFLRARTKGRERIIA